MKTCVAGKCIIRHPEEQKVLLVKRKIQDEWFFEPAGGRVEIDFLQKTAETLEACAQREVMEEAGLSIGQLQYVGSYYFFWLQQPDTCSICTLFFATATGPLSACKTVLQEECGATYLMWVSLQDLIERTIQFNPRHVGLESLIMSCVF